MRTHKKPCQVYETPETLYFISDDLTNLGEFSRSLEASHAVLMSAMYFTTSYYRAATPRSNAGLCICRHFCRTLQISFHSHVNYCWRWRNGAIFLHSVPLAALLVCALACIEETRCRNAQKFCWHFFVNLDAGQCRWFDVINSVRSQFSFGISVLSLRFWCLTRREEARPPGMLFRGNP